MNCDIKLNSHFASNQTETTEDLENELLSNDLVAGAGDPDDVDALFGNLS